MRLTIPMVSPASFAAKMLGLEADNAINLGKKGIVLAYANVVAGMEVGAPLPDQNVTGQNELPVSPLAPKTLGFAVASVTGTANALLMSKKLQIDHHRVTPPYQSI